MQMHFNDHDPDFDEEEYHGREGMGIIEALGWFLILPVLVLVLLATVGAKLGF